MYSTECLVAKGCVGAVSAVLQSVLDILSSDMYDAEKQWFFHGTHGACPVRESVRGFGKKSGSRQIRTVRDHRQRFWRQALPAHGRLEHPTRDQWPKKINRFV